MVVKRQATASKKDWTRSKSRMLGPKPRGIFINVANETVLAVKYLAVFNFFIIIDIIYVCQINLLGVKHDFGNYNYCMDLDTEMNIDLKEK